MDGGRRRNEEVLKGRGESRNKKKVITMDKPVNLVPGVKNS
jgi:hypothetical protein